MGRPQGVTRRELGRATLARQLLLERSPLGALAAIEALAGLQAQEPRPPFIGLWSRIRAFEPAALRDALRSGAVLRAPLLRGTLHLVSAADFRLLRGACQPALDVAARVLRDRAAGADPDAVCALARAALEERPRTSAQMRELMAERFPASDARALAYLARMHVPLALVPSEDEWGFPRDPALALAAAEPGEATTLVRRYLAAFGPASVADAQEWSGVRGLAPAFEALSDELVRLRDETGRELFDLPDAPRPPHDMPAPVRLLPEFDNLVLGHADRGRLIAPEHRPLLITKNLRVPATFLVDGEVAGTWSVTRRARSATLELVPFARLAAGVRRELEQESVALLAALEPGRTGEVRVTPR
jgi:hypothetical protein